MLSLQFWRLKKNTTSKTIQEYINDIKDLTDEQLALFIKNISFRTNTDNLIENIKNKLKWRFLQNDESRMS